MKSDIDRHIRNKKDGNVLFLQEIKEYAIRQKFDKRQTLLRKASIECLKVDPSRLAQDERTNDGLLHFEGLKSAGRNTEQHRR